MKIIHKDWLLFKSKIGIWQENYTDKLIREYIELLNGEESSVAKFHKLDTKMIEARKCKGVHMYIRRCDMFKDIVSLLIDGVITLDDLAEFSDYLQQAAEIVYVVESVNRSFEHYKDEYKAETEMSS